MMWAVFVLVVLTLQSSVVLAATTVCTPAKTTSATFSVVSRRNQTGHWLTDVSLNRFTENQPAENPKDSGTWQFDLSFSRSRCGPAETLRTTAIVTVPPPRPGPGYELRAGLGYYKFHPEGRNFAEAAAICEEEGAHLAIINSEEEASLMDELFARYPKATRSAFVGFHDKFEEGIYITIFGEPLSATGFTRWAVGQPDNAGGDPGEDCGTVHRTSGLNDLSCTYKAAFVCEQEL